MGRQKDGKRGKRRRDPGVRPITGRPDAPEVLHRDDPESSREGDDLQAAQAWQDPTTGLPGPEFWRIVVEAEAARAARYLRPVTLAFVEVTHNDGRAVGTEASSLPVDRVAAILRASCRSSDHVARLGPTRFGVLLSETGEIAAINFIERVRERASTELVGDEDGVAVLFGWASPTPSAAPEAWAALAEERLREDARTLALLAN